MPKGICSVDGCEKPAKTRGWCSMHYFRWLHHGDLGPAEPLRRPKNSEPPPCAIDGCDRPARHRGWCNAHYERWRRLGDVGGAELQAYRLYELTCNMDDCDGPQVFVGGLCIKHYHRWRKWGDPYYNDLGKGPENHMWRGDDIGYAGAHERVRRAYGVPSEHSCCICGQVAGDWAYDHTDPNELVERGLVYSTDPSRYQPMCRRCHIAFDTHGTPMLDKSQGVI